MNKKLITLVLLFTFCSTAEADQKSALNALKKLATLANNTQKSYCEESINKDINRLYDTYLSGVEIEKRGGNGEIFFSSIKNQTDSLLNIYIQNWGC